MASQARDRFQTYFEEKLWELIPAIYREEDGLAEKRDVLRAIIEVLAEQAALVRRSNDRLWEDQFIELCNDWAVPYIGDLVGTRMVSALNLRGSRADVAKTIYYRRRKGTLRVLEELISDITGWDGKAVEMFRRLGRARHGLDPRPQRLAGTLTGTLPGGWADLRRQRGAELTGGPFDEYHHTPDMRRYRGVDGRHSIPKLAFFLYRLPARELIEVTPRQGPNPSAFTADPSGRDLQIFMPRNRADDWDEWRSAREWELPAPMRCRVLGHAEYLITEKLIVQLINTAGLGVAAANDLRTIRGARFASEQRLRDSVATLANGAAILNPTVFRPLLAGALVEDCGKFALLPEAFRAESSPGVLVARERITSGNLENWAAAAVDKQLVVDPERGRMLFSAPPASGSTVSYWYGFPGEIGAGSYDRSAGLGTPSLPLIQGGGAIPAASVQTAGVTQIADSLTYDSIDDLSGIEDLILQAANQQRPYLDLQNDWEIDTGTNDDAFLTLDGLWVGASGSAAVVLSGDYERVAIRHSTLDPGGEDVLGGAIGPVTLVIEGEVEELLIERSILGPVRTQGTGIVEKLVVRDSIIQSTGGDAALALAATEVDLARVTIFGAVDVNRLYATEALITGIVDVTNTQDGCFRFSAALEGSRVPHPYESNFITDSNHFFASRRFGDPAYAQLSETSPVYLQRGAENGSEIGAYSGLMNQIKLDSLRAKAEEFAPFGLIPIFIFET
jgi:hypothetical protein